MEISSGRYCCERFRLVFRPVARTISSAAVAQHGNMPPPGHRRHRSASVGTIPSSCNPWVLYHMQLRDHILAIAESIHAGGWDRARHLLELLSRRVSTKGDATERVAACFFEALAVRYSRLSAGATTAVEYLPALSKDPTFKERMSAYMALNMATPFLRFAHLTATQSLLEALTSDGDEFLHIVDVDIAGYGAQWPYFLQALADKRREQGYHIKRIRITGIGNSLRYLQETGKQLDDFARDARVPLEFIPLVQHLDTLTPEMLDIQEGETVGVNCMMQLHTLLTRGSEMLTNFLAMLESIAPKVVTVAEAEASLNSPYFLERIQRAWNFYSVLFETLDATLPGRSAERARVEADWYRPEIRNVLAFEGSERVVRHQSYPLWQRFFEGNGFEILAPSWRSLSQAQILLKMHHPADGYRVLEKDGSIVLGWHDRPLFTVSSWKLTEMEDLLDRYSDED